MYTLTGVKRPKHDASQLTTIADNYRLLASAAVAAHWQTNRATAHVLDPAMNEGTDVVEAFRTTVTGPSSVATQLDKLADAAAETRDAYAQAAAATTSTLVSMDWWAFEGGRAFRKAILNGAPPHDLALLVQVIRNQLLKAESQGAAAVRQAFGAVKLPAKLPSTDQIRWGAMPPEIEELWVSLDIEERKQLLQELADQFADENGIPRRTLQWDLPPGGAWGERRRRDGSIHMNEHLLMRDDNADYPSAYMLHVVIHEMEHSWQYEVMGSSDPEQYGVSVEERDRMIERNEDHVREKGYIPRPVEVGARKAGRDFLDGLTVQDLRDML